MTLDERYTVQLGSHTYEVMPQPLPVLKHDLGPKFEGLVNTDVQGAGGLVDFFMQHAHALLSVFIDDLMPLHEWEGYPSEEARREGRFDREYAKKHAPTGPQIKLAAEVCLKANDLDLWKHLDEVVDPQQRREFVRQALAGVVAGNSPTTTSPNGSSQPGSASITSTTTPAATGPAAPSGD